MAKLRLSCKFHQVEGIFKFFDLKLQARIFILNGAQFFCKGGYCHARGGECIAAVDITVQRNPKAGKAEEEFYHSTTLSLCSGQ